MLKSCRQSPTPCSSFHHPHFAAGDPELLSFSPFPCLQVLPLPCTPPFLPQCPLYLLHLSRFRGTCCMLTAVTQMQGRRPGVRVTTGLHTEDFVPGLAAPAGSRRAARSPGGGTRLSRLGGRSPSPGDKESRGVSAWLGHLTLMEALLYPSNGGCTHYSTSIGLWQG